jgi:hypothetical protein
MSERGRLWTGRPVLGRGDPPEPGVGASTVSQLVVAGREA